MNKVIKALVERYVEAEHRFIELIYSLGSQEDMTEQQVKDYITFLGKLRLFQLDLLSVEEVPHNPLDWMQWMLSAGRHDSFFEKRVTDYVHKKLEGKVNYAKYR